MSDETQPPLGDLPPDDAGHTPRHRAPGSPDWQVPTGKRRGAAGLVVAALVTFALAFATAAGSVFHARLGDELRKGGRYADATVSEVTEDWLASTYPTCMTRVAVRFTDARGARHRATVDYSGCDTGLTTGDVITVLYPPSHPDFAVAVEGGAAGPTDDAVLLGSFAAFFSLMTVLFVGLAARSIAVRRSRRVSGHTGGFTVSPAEDDPQ